MYVLKLYTSTGKFIGEVDFDDVDDAIESLKEHITNSDTIAVISDKEYIDGIEII